MVRRVLLFAVVLGVMSVSIHGQVTVTESLLGTGFAITLAVVLDVGALLALNEVLTTRAAEVRRWGWTALLLAAGLSVGLNVWHAVHSGQLPLVAAVAVGAIPVVLAGVLSHLLAVALAAETTADPTGDPSAPATGPVRSAGPVRSEEAGPTVRPDAVRSGPGAVRSAGPAGPVRSAGRSADRSGPPVRKSGGPVRSAGPTPDRERSEPVRTDVADLLPLGRQVAAELAEQDRSLSRSALVAGIRERGQTVSTDRAGALLAALRSELPGADHDHADRSGSGSGPDHTDGADRSGPESGRVLRVVADRTDRPAGPEQSDQSAPVPDDRGDQADDTDRGGVEHDQADEHGEGQADEHDQEQDGESARVAVGGGS